MAIKINTIEELLENTHKIPPAALADIDKRITDWLAAGGSTEDGYIKQQFRFAENIINLRSV
jgi:hypothetical protein